jgi:hypothetical protein
MPRVGTVIAATSGGSGGGGGAQAGSLYPRAGATGATGQGFAGGDGFDWDGTYQGSGGGGGAGSIGGNASRANLRSGAGGNGVISTISGVSQTYAGGGGGGARDFTAGAGGAGGGGNGGAQASGSNGTAGLGGGGGGSSSNGGSGGSGVVILSFGPYLEVTRSPLATRTGSAFSNSIQVQLTNLDGTLFSSNSPVTVTSSATLILNGAPLTQSLTVNAVNGIATFEGLGFATSVTTTQTLLFTSDAFVRTSVSITPTFFARDLIINSANTSTGFMFGGEFYASSSAGISYLNTADLHAHAVANTISISVSGSISISSNVSITTSKRAITLRAGGNIHLLGFQ